MGKLHIMVYFVVFIRGILHYSQLPKFDNWAALFSNQYWPDVFDFDFNFSRIIFSVMKHVEF